MLGILRLPSVLLLLSSLVFLTSSCSVLEQDDVAVSSPLHAQGAQSDPSLQEVSCDSKGKKIWSNSFQEPDWMESWYLERYKSWGLNNLKLMSSQSDPFKSFLRVYYPAGSASQKVRDKENTPVGGGQFFAHLGIVPRDALCLSYYVRFGTPFNFVKGGKLPGLFGGFMNNGGKVPDGTNGFSTRYMWRHQGLGEVYAYLPQVSGVKSNKFDDAIIANPDHGTSIGRGNWVFYPGRWHHLEQAVTLNTLGRTDGRIQVWLDGKQVLDKRGIVFRTTNGLKIEGILFSTFFGGSDGSWATPQTVHIDFADFSVYSIDSP